MCVINRFVRRSTHLKAAIGLLLGGCSASALPANGTASAAVHCSGGTLGTAAQADAYRGCSVVSGDLRVVDTDLTDLSTLSELRRVSGSLVIVGNADLRDLRGLEQLRSVGAFVLRDNGGLYTAAGLSRLTEVGDLVIAGNPRLNSLSGIRALRRARSVEIRHNPRLCALGILPELQSVEQGLVVRANRGISPLELRNLRARVATGPVARPERAAPPLQAAAF
jgi:hypothetical protein